MIHIVIQLLAPTMVAQAIRQLHHGLLEHLVIIEKIEALVVIIIGPMLNIKQMERLHLAQLLVEQDEIIIPSLGRQLFLCHR